MPIFHRPARPTAAKPPGVSTHCRSTGQVGEFNSTLDHPMSDFYGAEYFQAEKSATPAVWLPARPVGARSRRTQQLACPRLPVTSRPSSSRTGHDGKQDRPSVDQHHRPPAVIDVVLVDRPVTSTTTKPSCSAVAAAGDYLDSYPLRPVLRCTGLSPGDVSPNAGARESASKDDSTRSRCCP